MGMAASQARYLALVARKSNCEYEGQQINQSRLNLANKSANLFNQMLGLNVPIPPTKQDFMKLQYTYVDGATEHTITDWHQLSSSDADGYNYVVDSEYTTKIYTGSQKKKTDPQVQFSGAGPSSSTSYSEQVRQIQEALEKIKTCQETYDKNVAAYNTALAQASVLSYYADNSTDELTSGSVVPNTSGTQYTVTTKTGDVRNYIRYNELTDKSIVETAVNTLKENGALDKDFSLSNVYYDSTSGTMAFRSDLDSVHSGSITILSLYYPTAAGHSTTAHGISETASNLNELKNNMLVAQQELDKAKAAYDALSVPTYVGNYALTPISELTDSQLTAITQIIKDMKANNITTNLTRCFDTTSGDYSNSTYQGGIFYYEQGNSTYFVTYYDLADSFTSSGGIIDNQAKLPVYTVSDVETTIKSSEKALLETDKNGRFTSVRFENDSVVYNLTVTEIEDNVAYEDAMNQYDYNKALYDKRVSDINAQTSLIQREDQDLELRLKQLDTEQNALATEIDAVAKVVKDNIEKSFKTFGG